jgi:membrane protein YdbS with pleckstrin-like domain
LQTDGLHINRGVLLRRHIIIPYTDIETVDTLINPFVARFLQLYSLQIKTHEVMDSEGIFRKKQLQIIPGLTSDAEKFLRAELLKDAHMQPLKKAFFDPVSGHYK